MKPEPQKRPTQTLNRSVAIMPWLRLVGAAALGVAAYRLIPHANSAPLRALWGWDIGVAVLIGSIMVMMARSTTDHMRRRAARQDLGRSVILTAIVAGALFSMTAIAYIQKTVKASHGEEPAYYLATIIGTIILSWFLVHLVFTLHYAHGYYGPAEEDDDADGVVGGLEFPSEPQPDYWDFMYFSFVVGMACQVSDVDVSGRMLRRLALFHGIVAFFFNTIILALTINIIASAL